MAPWLSRSRSSSRSMSANRCSVPVGARAVMPLGIKGSTTEWTEWSPGLDQSHDGDGQSAGPLAREAHVQSGLFVVRRDREFDSLILFVKRDGDLARDEVRFVLGLQREVVGQMTGSTELA